MKKLNQHFTSVGTDSVSPHLRLFVIYNIMKGVFV